ncbi:MAG TPA: hypothetical protein VFI42_03330 [Thermomicrobiaceae bacterium]|nr:hypothetical protein [Thermomicrobiaceae bacterium]
MALRFGRGPSFREVRGNLFNPALPGGNLIAAVLDRDLMAWSDRGGASRVLGDRWSEECSRALDGWLETERPVPGGAPFVLKAVARLDEDPRIAIQAGQHKLTNPDFVLYGYQGGRPVLQAADAKFAVDTIKPAQVSADSLAALLAIEEGLARQAIERTLEAPLGEDIELVRGVFISPRGPLTDYFLPRVADGPRARVDGHEVVLIPVAIARMFGTLPVTPDIGLLARIDRLPETPRENLLAAIYYFRCASACGWMWVEERTPLLSLNPPPELVTAQLVTETEERAADVESAYGLLERWYEDVEQVREARRAVAEVASVPVSMKEIRQLVETARGEEDRRLVRHTRAALERLFQQRLVDLVGEVPAEPAEPLPEVLGRIADATRTLRPELRREAEAFVAREPA